MRAAGKLQKQSCFTLLDGPRPMRKIDFIDSMITPESSFHYFLHRGTKYEQGRILPHPEAEGRKCGRPENTCNSCPSVIPFIVQKRPRILIPFPTPTLSYIF